MLVAAGPARPDRHLILVPDLVSRQRLNSAQPADNGIHLLLDLVGGIRELELP